MSQSTPMTGLRPTSKDDPDDAGYGWAMFFGFAVAVLAISLAVWVLDLTPSWWVLGAVVATHLGVTMAVLKIVLGALGPESETYPDLEAIEPASKATTFETAPIRAPLVASAARRRPSSAHPGQRPAVSGPAPPR